MMLNKIFSKWLCRDSIPQKSPNSTSSSFRHSSPDRDENLEKIINTVGTHNCGGTCVIKAHVKNGIITRIDTDDCPDTSDTPQIRACVRGRSYRKINCHPDRLKYPMKRVGIRGEGRFVRISWEEAVDTIAHEITRIKDSYGPSARYIPIGGPWGSIVPHRCAKRLLALDGGYLDSYNDYSTPQQDCATMYTYGDCMNGNSQEDLLNAKLIVLWGMNTAETIIGSLSNYYLRRAKDQGTRIIVIDPRYTDSVVAFADQWIPLRPTTDAALADAVAYIMITEHLQDQSFLDRCCLGFDEAHLPPNVPVGSSYRTYCLGISDGIPKTPEWGEKITGVPADTIRQFARELASIKPACILQGWGIQRHANGEQSTRGTMLLAAMTGNVGIKGGGCGGASYISRNYIPNLPLPPNPFPGSISAFLWTDAVLRGTEMTAKDGVTGIEKLPSNIKMILNLASGNLMNQHSDCGRTAKILQNENQVEFIVVSDNFMTPSARFADILLPGDNFFERDNIKKAWVYGDWVCYSNKLVNPPFECRNEYDWLTEVAERLGLREQFTEGRSIEDWCRWLTDEMRTKTPDFPSFEDFKKQGIYKWKHEKLHIAFEKEAQDPENHPFPTPSGKIELFSKGLYDMNRPEEIPAIPKYVPAWEGPEDPLRDRYPLQCISWHHRYRTHSIHDNNPWLNEAQPQVMWMNPKDGEKRNIKNGEKVKVFNDRGAIIIPVKLTPRIIPGVVGIPHGAWYTPDEKGVDIRGCINTITSQKPSPLAHGNPQHTNLVEVVKLKKGEL